MLFRIQILYVQFAGFLNVAGTGVWMTIFLIRHSVVHFTFVQLVPFVQKWMNSGPLRRLWSGLSCFFGSFLLIG